MLCDTLWRYNIKSNEGIFLGYSLHSKAYILFNKRTKVVVEYLHIPLDEAFTPDFVIDDCDNLPPLHDLSLNENINLRYDQVVQPKVEGSSSLQKQSTYQPKGVQYGPK